MKNEPLHIDRFICLITNDALEKSDAAAWYNCVLKHAPSGVLRSIAIVNNRSKPEAISMVHRVSSDDEHCYLVPLTRDLSEIEIEKIVHAFAEKRPKLDFDVETHMMTINAKDHSGISLDASKHLTLCNALAKQKHEDWIRERTSAGWRYGTTFDHEEKTHPLILPWDQLPDQYREPDMDWPQKLVAMLNDQGYAIIDKQELANLLKLLRGIV